MVYKETIRITKEVLRTIEPHLPAIIVFSVVYLALRKAGLTNSIIWSIMAPVVFAMITEFLSQAGRSKSEAAETSA